MYVKVMDFFSTANIMHIIYKNFKIYKVFEIKLLKLLAQTLKISLLIFCLEISRKFHWHEQIFNGRGPAGQC